MSNLKEILNRRKELFESFLLSNIYPHFQKNFHPKLSEACIYSINAGGKRLRPILTLSSFTQVDQELTDEVLYLASAVEMIHTYSLIHDDLPSMDNDDFRRGLPTLHKKFNEAIAILTGDALNSFAFSLITRINPSTDNYLHIDLIEILHKGAGGQGMVSGQIDDLENENNLSNFNETTLMNIHSKKTGALILSSCLLGNRLRSDHSLRTDSLTDYAQKLGILFQMTDDVLDEESTFKELGKTPGKDTKVGKLTYPALYGITKTKEKIQNLVIEMKALAEKFDSFPLTFFRDLPEYIARRKN
jgi:geranylgeranyl diphosphate synthase, type II